MDIDFDGPESERATIKFKNQGYGLFIRGQKLANDAANFRLVAAFLESQGGDGPRLGLMMKTLAGQYDKAARGEEPKAD